MHDGRSGAFDFTHFASLSVSTAGTLEVGQGKESLAGVELGQAATTMPCCNRIHVNHFCF